MILPKGLIGLLNQKQYEA